MKRWLSQLTLLLLSHFCLAQTTIVTIDSAVCQSAMPIVWNNEQVTLPPDFDFSTPVITINDTVHFADGHDSVTILNLTVNPSYLIDTFATACDVFIWYGVPFFSSRTYTRYGSTIHSCDSTIKLHLTINPSYSFDTAKVVCDSLLWAPHKFTQSTDTLNNSLSYQIFGEWRCHQVLDTSCTSTLTEYHYIVRIATKLCDVVLYPL